MRRAAERLPPFRKTEQLSRAFTPKDDFIQKRGQLFLGPHDEMLSIAAVCVNNPDRSPLRINS
jgi:hypothetical protein